MSPLYPNKLDAFKGKDFGYAPEMASWKNALLWAAYPFLLLVVVFGLIAAVNWDYESKLISIDPDGPDWTSQHLGLNLLAGAIGMALMASVLLFLTRIFWPKSYAMWFMAPMILITILFVFPSLFVVILAPASITMIQQMRSASK